MKKLISMILALSVLMSSICLVGCSSEEEESVIKLRVCNWEEYIDLGDWDEDELIDLEDGTNILGEESLVDEFEEWYFENYGQRVKVEYSTFGTCEDLYNRTTIGDVYDLACPSEYMIMKMEREGMLVPYSEEFHDTSIENNYYARGVSPFISSTFDDLKMSQSGMTMNDYASAYMWGTLGIVYNPEMITDEEAAHWSLITNDKFYRSINFKDSVRDAYFAGAAIYYYDEITKPEFVSSPDYHEKLSEILNRTDAQTVNGVEEILRAAKNNAYAIETDSGKADIVSGKSYCCEQWSGDAVYSMDQADEDGVELCYSTPSEGTNLWFDGWIMFKKGLEQDPRKQQAAEAFVNFLSMPENAIRNMYYIGYTSSISGGDSDLIYEYMDWTYGAEEDEEDTVDYSVGYFFDMEDPNADEIYTITTSADQVKRQLFAQYPTKDVVDRAVVMACFDDEGNERINRMWTNVRCFDLKSLFN